MNYEEAKDYLFSARVMGVMPGLSRITALMKLLGNPEQGLQIIHVAGTNGKGSVCAYLENALRYCGHKTGFFSSPWLVEPVEMFRLNGVTIAQEVFASLADEIKYALADLRQQEGLPTEYEMYSAMAFLLFRKMNCTVVIIETCMGGRFDTTNVYSGPNFAVFTRIALDHQKFLGDTVDEIAWHKAGIMRSLCSAVKLEQSPEVDEVFIKCSKQTDTQLSIIPAGAVSDVVFESYGTKFKMKWNMPKASEAENESWSGAYLIRLYGDHQAENAALAIGALRLLSSLQPCLLITPDKVRKGIAETFWGCRFELIGAKPLIIADCAHNTDGIGAFVDTFIKMFPQKKATVIFGVLRDKDVKGMLSFLDKISSSYVIFRPISDRAMELNELKLLVSNSCCGFVQSDTIQSALDAAYRVTSKEGIIVAVGSITWVGHLRELVKQKGY